MKVKPGDNIRLITELGVVEVKAVGVRVREDSQLGTITEIVVDMGELFGLAYCYPKNEVENLMREEGEDDGNDG